MLAQDWLYGQRSKTKYDSIVEKYLKLPTVFNKHSSVSSLSHLAERIVFTDDIPTMLYDMHDNKQLTFQGVLSSARLPYDCFWLEYSTTIGISAVPDIKRVPYGALIRRNPNGSVRMYIIVGMEFDEGTISSVAYIVEFDEWPPLTQKEGGITTLTFNVLWAFNFNALRIDNTPTSADFKSKALQDLGSTVNEIIFGIFLVTQPRVYTDEPVRHKASYNARRVARGKSPLLEYRKIKLHIYKPRKHYTNRTSIQGITDSTDSEAAIRHRRYHKVMGHFRHYINNDNPRSVWIEPHYRGDPKLGVTFTERDVSR